MSTPVLAPSVASVPRLWPWSTIVCLGGGPSLTPEDVDACRGRARVIAIKDAIRLAPWADVLYGAGAENGGGKWWPHYGPSLKDFEGLRYTLDPEASTWATVLKNTGFLGLESDPSGLRIGKHSGYQAINLAVHLGASKIVLLGYDMQPAADRDHWFGAHPYHAHPIPYAALLELFPSIVEPLQALGITVINASRSTALTCFLRLSLAEALA